MGQAKQLLLHLLTTFHYILIDMKTNSIKDTYLACVKAILENDQELLSKFMEFWEYQQYRSAYLLMHDATDQKIWNSNDLYKKAKIDFYWGYVS